MTGAGSFSSEGIMHKQSWEQYLKEYAEDKGFELEITNGFKALIIDKEQDYELWEAKMREIYDWTVGKGYKESFEYFIEHDSAGLSPKYEINDINAYKKIMDSGKSISIDSAHFPLYSTEDVDGNGLFDDVVYKDVGGHSMFVVGTTTDRKLVVSSWGSMFVLDPNYVQNITVYDFGR